MNCEICKKKVQVQFLEKVLGTYVKDAKGKRHLACFECQKRFPDKKDLLAHIH